MRQFGIAIVTPAFCDQLSFQQSMDPRALQPESYGHAYKMSLSCFNQQEEVDHAAVQATLAAEAATTVFAPAPSIEQVWALLEQQWAHMCDSDDSHLPHLAFTQDRVYVKDVSAAQDAQGAGEVAQARVSEIMM